MKRLNEERDREVIEDWYTRAGEMAPDGLAEFLRHLQEDFEHDYGTICHAITAGALATASAMDRGPCGGITGFQAGFVGSGFLQRWDHIDGPWRIVRYGDMLYPQHSDRFAMTVSRDTADWLRAEARKNLDGSAGSPAASRVAAHWRMIADGILPFGYRVEEKESECAMSAQGQRKLESLLRAEGLDDDRVTAVLAGIGVESTVVGAQRLKAALETSGFRVATEDELGALTQKPSGGTKVQ